MTVLASFLLTHTCHRGIIKIQAIILREKELSFAELRFAAWLYFSTHNPLTNVVYGIIINMLILFHLI